LLINRSQGGFLLQQNTYGKAVIFMAKNAAAGSMGKIPNKGTFILGSVGEKEPLNGKTQKGGDLRSRPGKNQGSMPKSM
jgi:hypothetical protein